MPERGRHAFDGRPPAAPVPVTNTTEMPIYVGGAMVPPGETRHFPAHQVPEHLRPKAPAPARAPEPDTVLALLDGTVADIAGALPGLSDEDLARLRQAEEDGKTRKGVMEAITEEVLRRADARTEGAEAGEPPAAAGPQGPAGGQA